MPGIRKRTELGTGVVGGSSIAAVAIAPTNTMNCAALVASLGS